tara:strand:+ start:3335 stop:3949 length:615 start_codon:yes stop_codon:yes gene_type:complete
MALTKIIHQTWKDENIPDFTVKYTELVKKHLPDWEYKFWTDEAIHDFFDFSADLSHYYLYGALSPRIKQIDLFKYLVVYTYGGLFIDLDIELFKDPTPLLKGPVIIGSSAIFYSEPNHPFWIEVFKGIKKNKNKEVLWATGPKLLLGLAEDNKEVEILDFNNFFPIRWHEKPLYKEILGKIAKPHFPNGYGFHHMMHSWASQED